MISEAKRLGDVFKTRREEMELSLKEVESATSIRSNYLDAIELGDIEKFLSTVYMYGFMRQYALYLNLDIEKIAREYPEAFKLPKSEHEFTYGLGTIEMRAGLNGNRWKRYLPNLLWGCAFLGVFLVAWGLVKFLGII